MVQKLLIQLLTLTQLLKLNSPMKQILEAIGLIVKTLWPKSRWGNLIYLIIGYILSQYDVLLELWQAILAIFK